MFAFVLLNLLMEALQPDIVVSNHDMWSEILFFFQVDGLNVHRRDSIVVEAIYEMHK